jgi:ABC-type nitrate/sulfonate/bicarbonate transport system permease component
MKTLLQFLPAIRALSADAPPETGESRRRRPMGFTMAVPLCTLIALGLLEECLARAGIVRVPPVSVVVAALADEALSGRLWPPLGSTAVNWLVSLVLSFFIALILAVALNASAYLHDLSAPLIGFLRPLPCTALIPLVILSLGATAEGVIFLTTFGTLWQMLPILSRAVGRSDPVAFDTARVFGFTRLQIFRWITLPALEPYMLSALRIGATASLMLLISMELLTGASGIGRIISLAYAGSNLSLMYAYVLLCGLLGVGFNIVLGRLVISRSRLTGGRPQ